MMKDANNAHAQRYKLTSDDEDRERPRLMTVVGSNGTGTTRLRKTQSHDQVFEFLVR